MAWDNAFRYDTLICTGKSGGEKEFEVRVELFPDGTGTGRFYYVKPLPPEEQSEEHYFASLKEVGQNLLQTEGLKNGLTRYQRYGIGPTLIPRLATALSVQIRSSQRRAGDSEMRTDDATGMWERMVRDGSASYDRTEDRYYCPPR